MTEPSGDELVPAGDPIDAQAGDPAPDPAGPARPSLFSLEGRTVPALYLVSWIAVLIGAGAVFISVMSGGTSASPWLFLVGIAFLSLGLVAGAGSQAVERGHREDLAFRGPSPALVLLAVVAITILLQIVILAPLSALGLDARSPAATVVNYLLTTLVYVGLVRMLVVGQGALTWTEMGVFAPDARAMVDLAAGAALAVPVVLVVQVLTRVLDGALRLGASATSLPPMSTPVDVLLALLAVAVLAPVGQELFFRGYATAAWERAAGRRAAIIRGAILFALVVVLTQFDVSFSAGAPRALVSFLTVLPLALALGWVFLGRRSLYAAIGMHAAYSAITLLLGVLAIAA